MTRREAVAAKRARARDESNDANAKTRARTCPYCGRRHRVDVLDECEAGWAWWAGRLNWGGYPRHVRLRA